MLEKKIRSFGYAISGIRIAWSEEHNFRLEVVIASAALALAWFLEVSRAELLFIVGTITVVLMAEAFNTALEELCDKFHADPDPHIAKIKDLSAAAVMLASLGALVIGVVIFLPRLIALV